MKNMMLCMALFASYSLSALQAQAVNSESVLEPTTTIVKIADFTTERFIVIYDLFKNDPHYVLVNSCEALGLIVIDSKENTSVSSQVARLQVLGKLEERGLLDGAEIIEGMTKVGVTLDCRERMHQLLDPDGPR